MKSITDFFNNKAARLKVASYACLAVSGIGILNTAFAAANADYGAMTSSVPTALLFGGMGVYGLRRAKREGPQ